MSEPEGFEEYIQARRAVLVRTGYLLTGDAHMAEDLVQTALVRVWPHWNRVRRERDVDAYVRKVLMNVFLSAARRRRWREVPAGLGTDSADDAGSASASPSGSSSTPAALGDAYAEVDDRLAMVRLLRTLPPRQRAVIVMRYYLDLSEADAASLLGCSAGTVKSQTSKAMKNLATSQNHTGALADVQDRRDAR